MSSISLRRGVISGTVVEQRPCQVRHSTTSIPTGSLCFVSRARQERQFPLPERTPAPEVLTHLNLLDAAEPSLAAIRLFGRDPQRFIPAAELRCMHFHGTEIQRPAPSYQIFKGNLFEQTDQGADFVLSKLDRSVGTRELGPRHRSLMKSRRTLSARRSSTRWPIAITHRQRPYRFPVFSDRVEIWNPGELPPELTPARLREPHASIARNARICEAMFLARYIEKFGTGTIMMIRAVLRERPARARFRAAWRRVRRYVVAGLVDAGCAGWARSE